MSPIIKNVQGFLNFISDLKEGDEKEFQFLHPKEPGQLTDFTNAVRLLSAGRMMEIKAKKGHHKIYVVRISETNIK